MSWESDPTSTAYDSYHPNPAPQYTDYLGFLDIDALVRLQNVLSGPIVNGHSLGIPGVEHGSLRLGSGLSFSVRRVSGHLVSPFIDSSDTSFNKDGFVVIKQPRLRHLEFSADNDFPTRLRAVMMEVKILYHAPVRQHPNIFHMHSFMWDTQDDPTVIAPSLILEYADLGTLSDCLLPRPDPIPTDAKRDICLDVARGLAFLHSCGIIHGDVKTDNVLLFQDQNRPTKLRAKLSDFGSSLIEVFEGADAKQHPPLGTRVWRAPEISNDQPSAMSLDTDGLRRTDLYPYGLLVWSVLSNGMNLWDQIPWARDVENLSNVSSPSTTKSDQDTRRNAFIRAKQDGDVLLHHAVTALRRLPVDSVDLQVATLVFEKTIRAEPGKRSKDLKDIIHCLSTSKTESVHEYPEPSALIKGDFGVTNANFASRIWLLRTTPPSFRAFITHQLTLKSKHGQTEEARAWSALALGICQLQGFYTTYDDINSINDSNELALQNFILAAELGNPTAAGIIVRLSEKTPPLGRLDHEEQAWLVSATLDGSAMARKSLKQRFPERYWSTIAWINSCHDRARDYIAPYEMTGIQDIPELDPGTGKILRQPGITRLQFASYVGALDVCKTLLRDDPGSLQTGDTCPLHYAVLGGSISVVKHFLELGANPSSQTSSGVTPMHLAMLSHASYEMLPILISYGADPNGMYDPSKGWPFGHGALYMRGGTPLHLAVFQQDQEAAELLLSAGADANLPHAGGISPLEEALRNRSIQLLETLMPSATADVSHLPCIHDLYRPLAGYLVSPMQQLVFWPSPADEEFVQAAIECIRRHGLSFDYRGLLSAALDANCAYIVDLCLRNLRADSDRMKPYRQRGPEARNNPDAMAIDFLLTPDLKLILSGVIAACSADVIEIVLRYVQTSLVNQHSLGTPFLNLVGSRQFTSPTEACRIVDAIIAAGVDLTARDEMGHGPLHAAVFYNNHHVVDALLRHELPRADVERALAACIAKGSSRLAKMMIDRILKERREVLLAELPVPIGGLAGAMSSIDAHDPNLLRAVCDTWEFGRDDDINSAILNTIISRTRTQPNGQKALDQRLREFAHPIFKQTPLHHAARTGNIEAVKILVGAGAPINASHEDPLSSLLDGILSTELDDSSSPFGLSLTESFNRGQTPLDHALQRRWSDAIYVHMNETRRLIQELRVAGGTYREEMEYDRRTADVVNYLRSKGAQTRAELYSLPASVNESQKMVRTAHLEGFKESKDRETVSETSNAIMAFFSVACGLPSVQLTQSEYPGLLQRRDESRPRFSALLARSILRFNQILSNYSQVIESEFRTSLADSMKRFQAWAESSHAVEGRLDAIQAVPPGPRSIILAAALTYCFYELLRTLELVGEFLNDLEEYTPLDSSFRCQEILSDVNKVIQLLTDVCHDFNGWNDAVVVEFETAVDLKIRDLNDLGGLEASLEK